MSKKANVPAGKDGAPRWTYIAGSIVGIATLAWAIASYFIPKPEPAKPATPGVTVGGTGNVVVGAMSGGTINVNSSPASAASKAASAVSKAGSAQ